MNGGFSFLGVVTTHFEQSDSSVQELATITTRLEAVVAITITIAIVAVLRVMIAVVKSMVAVANADAAAAAIISSLISSNY